MGGGHASDVGGPLTYHDKHGLYWHFFLKIAKLSNDVFLFST